MSKLTFNFSRGTKTPKGTIRPCRMVVPGTKAYEIYELAIKLQTADGIKNAVAMHKYVDLATKQMESNNGNQSGNQR